MQRTEHLFVYGTLRPGARHDLQATLRRHARWLGPGQAAGRLTLIGKVAPNPAFMTNWCHVYVAQGLHQTGELDLDEGERLEAAVVPVKDVLEGMGSGELVNSITAMSLYCYLRHTSSGIAGRR